MPAEARRAIEAGYAKSLMRDWLDPCKEVGNTEVIYLLAPASKGYEGRDAPTTEEMMGEDAGGDLAFMFLFMFSGNFTKGPCVMQDEQGLCKLHETDFKPLQCRGVLGCDHSHNGDKYTNYEIAKTWDTNEGREVLELWQQSLAAEQ